MVDRGSDYDQDENNGDKGEDFIYSGEEGSDIPWDVIHVNVHPSVNAIKDGAFELMAVNLGEGLEEIGN
jgi:hypothetical protein